MLGLQHNRSMTLGALVGWTVLFMTPGTGSAADDIVIDEFSHVDIFENPWPYVQTSPGGTDAIIELVENGVIQGVNGRVRETDPHLVGFGFPGKDYAEMGVETTTGTFDHTATSDVANILQFSYGFIIENHLNADLSETIGLRIDIADLQPDPGGYLQMSARISDGSVISESSLVFESEPGPHSILLLFIDFDAAGVVDLADIDAIEISLYASPGTDFSIERLVAAQAIPGDANADAVVNMADLMAVIGAWGDCKGCMEDLDDDGVVGIIDLLIVLANWGS